MPSKERTVIERLDDIENKIPSFEHLEPRPISEVIGRPFADYLNDATIYGVENDIRKFKRRIKKQRTAPIVGLSILIPTLIFDVISFVINKQLEWVLICITFLSLICPILMLAVLSKQKNKQPMHSFWNMENIDFYLVKEGDHNKIVKEERNGPIFYIMLIIKIITIIASCCGVFWYLFAFVMADLNGALYWVGLILGFIIAFLNVIPFSYGKPYYFLDYIFETKESYITYPDLDYFKK